MQTIIERLLDCFERGAISRRQAIGGLTALVAATAAGRVTEAGAPGATSTFQAAGLNHIALRVTDIPRSRDFYIKHLGMEVMRESAGNCFLRCGEHFVALFRGESAGMDHYCYSVEGYTTDGAAEKLRAQGIQPRVTGNRIYFPDPDGLTVQLAARGFRG
ncbi:MAG: VOC family protein [Vicinamibacteraceae bacterium]